MMLNETLSHYDVLEISPDASPHEIQAAYLRLKAAYSRDSVALYSLFSKEETQNMLTHIETAHRVLSNPAKRKAYDRDYSNISAIHAAPTAPSYANVVSIDRVPPMADIQDEDSLISPPTDFGETAEATEPDQGGDGIFSTTPPQEYSHRAETTNPSIQTPRRATIAPETLVEEAPRTSVHEIIENEQEWRGTLIKQVRETQGISIEELAEHTKISKTHLIAIEAENYPKLPASVFLRGFLVQIAKKLKLPPEPLINAYLGRYKSQRLER